MKRDLATPETGQLVGLEAPVFRAPSMKRLVATLGQLAPREVTVTLLGETGTGKDVLARWVHAHSRRRRGPFVPINCAAIPEALFESELFGRERGAFTGATERAIGKVEAAHGGTLFLDEVTELPLTAQPKLLRFLEARRFSRVGGTRKHDADVRLICAAGRPLETEVKAGRLRADLFYRIQGISLSVPPLRQRTGDIEPLLDAFTRYFAARHEVRAPTFPRRVRALLLGWPWPGNVRELRNLVEQLCLLREGRRLSVTDLPPEMASGGGPDTLTVDLHQSLDELTDQLVRAVLRAEGGNASRAAVRLGISARTISRLQKR